MPLLCYVAVLAKWHYWSPWGTTGGKKNEIKKTMRQREKERFHPKGPSLPGGSPYTVMIASSMCVCLCVCVSGSSQKEPLMKWMCKVKKHCWVICAFAFYGVCVWFLFAVKCSIGTYRPRHKHTSKILMLALTLCFFFYKHMLTHTHSAVEAD